MVYKNLIYIAIIVAFIILRLCIARRNCKPCQALIYRVPPKTYFWQIAGMIVILAMFSGIIFFNTKHEIDAYMPNIVFVALVGMLAGFCALSVVTFAFTPVGIYENGILTHYIFLCLDEIESYEFVDSNMLNIGRETKTVIFKIKDNNISHPSFEYPARDEKKIRDIFARFDLQEHIDIE